MGESRADAKAFGAIKQGEPQDTAHPAERFGRSTRADAPPTYYSPGNYGVKNVQLSPQ